MTVKDLVTGETYELKWYEYLVLYVIDHFAQGFSQSQTFVRCEEKKTPE